MHNLRCIASDNLAIHEHDTKADAQIFNTIYRQIINNDESVESVIYIVETLFINLSCKAIFRFQV